MTSSTVTRDWPDYELLDSGDGERLERFGRWVVRRPSQIAVWRRSQKSSVWDAAHGTFVRGTKNEGSWRLAGLPESWHIDCDGRRFLLKPTGSGQIGIFPEQLQNWRWIRDMAAETDGPFRVINLFAYTGGTTTAAASGGAQVCHVDAVRGIVQWASENAEASRVGEGNVRWIVDDVAKFLKREVRRGNRYEGIALDPPSFGRGRQGQVFKFERDIAELLDLCGELLSERARFLLLTCHTPGITAVGLENLLAPLQGSRGGHLTAGESLLTGADGVPPLPAGVYARWEGATASPKAQG